MAQEKFWMVYAIKNEGRLEKFDNYEDAADEAKRKAAFGDVYILAPVGYVKQPVPDLLVIPVE
jgi:hypothetical protein